MGLQNISPNEIIAIIIVIFLAIGIHEYCHAKFADLAGDPTPRNQGRVTLNLTNHFEPVGTMMMVLTALVGFGIGWGKPVPMNPGLMKNPRWDYFTAVLAGPVSNLIQAAVWALIFRIVAMTSPTLLMDNSFLYLLLLSGVLINIRLFFFNLIPIGPLDGQWLLGLLMPEPQRVRWFQWHRAYGGVVLLVLVIGSQLMGSAIGFSLFTLIDLPSSFVVRFLLGV